MEFKAELGRGYCELWRHIFVGRFNRRLLKHSRPLHSIHSYRRETGVIPACLHLLCYQEPVEANLHDGMPNIRSVMPRQWSLMAIGAIASKAKNSARPFDKLCYLSETDLTARTIPVDQSGRLKLWAANIGRIQWDSTAELPWPPPKKGAEGRWSDQRASWGPGRSAAGNTSIVSGDRRYRTGSVDDLVFESRALNDAVKADSHSY